MSRRSECRRVEDLLACVRAGESRALILVGPPGIGKSWLCGQAAARADGFTVVRTRGLQREAHLGYSGLFDVLTPLLDGRLDRLPPARGDALRGALRIAAAPGGRPVRGGGGQPGSAGAGGGGRARAGRRRRRAVGGRGQPRGVAVRRPAPARRPCRLLVRRAPGVGRAVHRRRNRQRWTVGGLDTAEARGADRRVRACGRRRARGRRTRGGRPRRSAVAAGSSPRAHPRAAVRHGAAHGPVPRPGGRAGLVPASGPRPLRSDAARARGARRRRASPGRGAQPGTRPARERAGCAPAGFRLRPARA